MKSSTSLVLILLFCTAYSLYDENSKVVKLTKENFQKLVINSNEPWMVEFYAPWCGHCKALAPEYNKAAKALEGIINVGAVDMDAEREVGSPYGVSSYPTVKFFGVDKTAPVDFDGERKKNAIVDWLLDRAREISLSRLGVEIKPQPSQDDSKVHVLTDANFDEQVMQSQEAWFVEFYAPWCGHCKQLLPEWNKLSHQADIPIAKVDATVHTALKTRFSIEGFPTILYFPAGSNKRNHRKYEGGRSLGEMLSYLQKQKEEDKTESERVNLTDVTHITNEDRLQTVCKNLCVLGFLTANEKEREDHVAVMKKAGLTLIGKANMGWIKGSEFEDFEAELGILGSGYPQVVVLDFSGKKFYKFEKQLTVENLNDFVKGILKKTETGTQIPTLPRLASGDL